MTRALLLTLAWIALLYVIRAWLRDRRVAGRPPAGREAPPRGWDPYAVLGLEPGATADEVSRAYRTQMKRYHPDRVADLGPEMQAVAHRMALDIQRAYDELGRRG